MNDVQISLAPLGDAIEPLEECTSSEYHVNEMHRSFVYHHQIRSEKSSKEEGQRDNWNFPI